MLRPTSTSLRLVVDQTRSRQAVSTSFGTAVQAGLTGHIGKVLQTLGLSAVGVQEIINGQTPSSPTDRRTSAFLALQEATQMETRRFTTLSNASKARHDIAMNTINNIK